MYLGGGGGRGHAEESTQRLAGKHALHVVYGSSCFGFSSRRFLAAHTYVHVGLEKRADGVERGGGERDWWPAC